MERCRSRRWTGPVLLLLVLGPSLSRAAEGSGDWVPLFNGENLEGFEQINGTAKYTVEDGAIVGRTAEGSPNSFLCTVEHYSDFELKFEVLVDDALNSGVQIRSNSLPEYRNGRVHGYQVEIATNGTAGFIYDEARRGWLSEDRSDPQARAAFRKGAWNRYRVRCVGDLLETWVNDVPVARVRDSMTRSGFIGLQVHAVRRGTGPFRVCWRKLFIRKLGSPGFALTLRRRVKGATGAYFTRFEPASWDPDRSAVVVCDMWDTHHCPNAAERVGEMAPRLNRFVARARQEGAVIIHAPSSCMEFYRDHPARVRAQRTPAAANLPADIGSWCRKIPPEEKVEFPVDDSDGGCDADAAKQEAFSAALKERGRDPASPWKRQIDVIEIADDDYISDSGVEIWNILENRAIDNVMLLGVHANMCVLGRPFGLRQMVKNGKNTVLVRDLTDTMYNPAMRPFLDHFRGTDRVVEHIEKYVCPSITSDQLLGGLPFRFEKDEGPRVVFLIGEREYHTRESLPRFARDELEPRGVHCTFVHVSEKDPNDFPGLELVKEADVVFVSVRRRALRDEQLALLREHLAAGKGLVGIRTASHAFDPHGELPEGHGAWREFDREVLGADYEGHFGATGPRTVVRVLESAADHPILAGIPQQDFEVACTLYKTRNPQEGFTPLMEGRLQGTETREVCAWTHVYRGARVFYTSLGHAGEFEQPFFRRLLVNGVFWAAGRTAPQKREGG